MTTPAPAGVVLEGRVVMLGDNVNTDNILPGRYLNVTDPAELGAHLLETYPGEARDQVRAGDILVAGVNFGMGSSREQAPIAIRARGVAAIVAVSFARIFLRNCVNLGLPAVECPQAAAALRDGDRIQIALARGTITAPGHSWEFAPQPPFLAEIAAAGGLVGWVSGRLAAQGAPPGGPAVP